MFRRGARITAEEQDPGTKSPGARIPEVVICET
jgi:hypothetical protein